VFINIYNEERYVVQGEKKVGDVLESLFRFYQSLRPTQRGLMLNIG
jgi:hypothetical protein